MIGFDDERPDVAAGVVDFDRLTPEAAREILVGLSTALFPEGLGELVQLTWEPTDAPPSFPLDGTPDASSEADARLRSAELRYRTLIEQIPAVTFMAVLGEGANEIYVSPYIETLLGFTQEEWLEDPFLWYEQLHPDDRELWVREFARGITTGGPFRAECRLIARDGRTVWVRGEARLVKDAQGRPLFLQGVAFDITESKRAHERVVHHAVRRTEERYRDLVEQLGAIFWEAEPRTGRFSFVSRGSERILGFPASRWIDDPEFWLSRVHPEDVDDVRREWRRALAEVRDCRFEFRAITAEGREVWLQNGIRFPESPSSDGSPLGVIIDVTERKRWERELADTLEREQAARAEAEALNRVKDEFLATMSHELRTPVHAVIGWSEILETTVGDEAVRQRALKAIRSNSRAQAQMLEDLFDVSRIVTGKLNVSITPVDLGDVTEASLETVKLACDAKRIGLELSRPDTPVPVLGDPDRLRQVVNNLLTNAVKFTPDGGRIDVGLRMSERSAVLSVSDTGQGIPPEFLPFIFGRFRQADGSSTRKHAGLGLGLALVRHLTEMHGGTVEADSPGEGLGATFTVTLPLDVDAPSSDAAPRDDHPGADAQLAGARVLVVDDHPDSLELMGTLLARAGARVSQAGSASEALELLARTSFDLLVCDIAMPVMDGYALIQRLREGEGRNHAVPAAAVTAYGRPEDGQRALAAGYQAFVAKPFDASSTLTELGRLATRREPRRSE